MSLSISFALTAVDYFLALSDVGSFQPRSESSNTAARVVESCNTDCSRRQGRFHLVLESLLRYGDLPVKTSLFQQAVVVYYSDVADLPKPVFKQQHLDAAHLGHANVSTLGV